MPPISLSSSEASSLRKISSRPCLKAELPEDHSAKLVNYGLACREAMMLRITARGQVELLASNYKFSLPSTRALRQRLLHQGLARFRRSPV